MSAAWAAPPNAAMPANSQTAQDCFMVIPYANKPNPQPPSVLGRIGSFRRTARPAIRLPIDGSVTGSDSRKDDKTYFLRLSRISRSSTMSSGGAAGAAGAGGVAFFILVKQINRLK